jgi:PAS domain S-box-containing protein
MPVAIARRKLVLPGAALLVVLIAIADWRSADNIPLGFLYLVPMLMLGRILKPWQTVVTAALCTFLAELFDPFPWDLRTGIPRDTLYFAAFVTVGIFVYTAHRNNQVTLAHLHEIELQRNARQEAEEQLKILIESSPAAILTANATGNILTANDAAHRILGLAAKSLTTLNLQQFFPALANIARTAASDQVFRAVMQSRGYRADGETFLAEICFSTYRTKAGARLAALILDASEELRTREESSLHQMLAGSRIAVAAVSHEIRNVCGAISVVHQNLLRSKLLGENKDFEALGNLVLALEKIASVDLLQYPDEKSEVDLHAVFDDLKIVITPALLEDGIHSNWNLDPTLPTVWADRTHLLQIFLNLTTNSIRALQASQRPRMLTIAARRTGHLVAVELIDNAGGVPHPEELFRPFQPGAHATGLGLYLSRAFARSFGGDLHYTALPGHASFTVTLPVASNPEGISS